MLVQRANMENARGWHCHDQAKLQGWLGKFVLPYPFWLNWNPQYSWSPHVLAVCLITLFSHHHSIHHYSHHFPWFCHYSHHLWSPSIITISCNLPTAFSIIPSYIPFLSQLYGFVWNQGIPPNNIQPCHFFNGKSGIREFVTMNIDQPSKCGPRRPAKRAATQTPRRRSQLLSYSASWFGWPGFVPTNGDRPIIGVSREIVPKKLGENHKIRKYGT